MRWLDGYMNVLYRHMLTGGSSESRSTHSPQWLTGGLAGWLLLNLPVCPPNNLIFVDAINPSIHNRRRLYPVCLYVYMYFKFTNNTYNCSALYSLGTLVADGEDQFSTSINATCITVHLKCLPIRISILNSQPAQSPPPVEVRLFYDTKHSWKRSRSSESAVFGPEIAV